MAYERILILESTWAASEDDYIGDSRSTARVYLSFETLQSRHEQPVFAVHRPLLAARFVEDIRQFVELLANTQGPNLIILSAHGSFRTQRRSGGKCNVRRLRAIDGLLRLSRDIHALKGYLERSVLVLDSCEVGTNIGAFRSAAGCLGAVGFRESVSWVDSAALVLGLLLNLQEKGVFSADDSQLRRVRDVIDGMSTGPYESLARHLGLETAFASMPVVARGRKPGIQRGGRGGRSR